MSFSRESNFFDNLLDISKKLTSHKTPSAIHKELKELYQVIQKCPTKFDSFTALPVETQEAFLLVTQILVSIISNPDFSADLLLLSCTCLSVLVAELFSPEFASVFLISLYSLVGENTQGANQDDFKEQNCERLDVSFQLQQIRTLVSNCSEQSNLGSVIHEFTHDDNESSRIKVPTFHQIALLHGVLSCQRTDLFPFRSKHFNHQPFLMSMFNSVHLSCLTPCSSQYHAFSILVNWLKTCHKLLPSLIGHEDSNQELISCEVTKMDMYFSLDSQILSKILSLLESNWESPIKGVSTFVKEAYKVLVALSAAECEYLNNLDFSLVYYLLDLTMKLSWKVKGKYLVLSIILQYVDYKEFLEKYPDAPNEVIFNLKANYASSVISEVYKSIVMSMKKCNKCPKIVFCEWCRWWKEPIVKSLLSEDKLLIQSVCNLILPWTLNSVTRSYDLFINIFEKENEIAPLLMLLRIGKESGMCRVQKRDLYLLCKYLHHQSTQLRMEILSILCSSSKKSESFTDEELSLLQAFVRANLNIDSTPFQQLLLSQLRVVFVRIRDSLVKEYRLKCKDAHLLPEYQLKSINVHLKLNQAQLKFVDKIASLAVLNTFPGACFQRRRISLHILNIIFDVFIVSPQGNKRKEKPSKFVKQVIQIAQMQEMWNFFNDGTLLNLFPCITDYTDEIRALTYNIMVEFSTWPGVYGDVPCEVVVTYGFELCCNPDFRSNEAGALLISLVYEKLYIQNGSSYGPVFPLTLPFLYDIIRKTGYMDSCTFTTHFMMSAETHGLLLALQYCLNHSKDCFRSLSQIQEDKIVGFVDTVMQLCETIIQEVLTLMKGENRKNLCPSFSDIGEALENLVMDHPSMLRKPAGSNIVMDITDVPKRIELLLTCCWHKIKNSCFVLCELASCIYEMEIDRELKNGKFHKIAYLMSSVLIACRHRGIVDACCLALNKFCTMLLRDYELYEEICKSLLNKVFDALSDATATSVTRRSAGLPSLVQAVVSSENNNIQRKLLLFTIQKLLECFNQPMLSEQTFCDTTDLPQAHAYHILKALVMDSSLSQAILSYLDLIVPACISGFSSSLWPIRNGALQLFGVLLPRICGQKKVKDEDSEHNLVSSSELFARCPSLKVYLHQQLRKCVQLHHEKKLCSELVPVLSIIVKLSPPQENAEEFVTEFKNLLLELLDVPIWNVRDLVSSALSVMVTVNDVLIKIDELKRELQANSFFANKTHGSLLVIQKMSKRKNFFPDVHGVMKSLAELYNLLYKTGCPLLVGVVLDTILIIAKNIEDPMLEGIQRSLYVPKSLNRIKIQKTLHFPGTLNGSKVGEEFLESKVTVLRLRTTEKDGIPAVIEELSKKDTSIMNECLQFLMEKLSSERTKPEFYSETNLKYWKRVLGAVLEYTAIGKHPSTVQLALKFLIDLCYDWKSGAYILSAGLQPNLDVETGLSVSALYLTVLSLCIKASLQHEGECDYLEKWSMLLNSYSQPRSPDILRMQAACSIACLGPWLVEYFSDKIKNKNCEKSIFFFLNLCENSFLLLQDEDEEIRNKACEFPSNIPHEYDIDCLQFNTGIQVIFKYMYEVLQGHETFVLYLWNRLQNYPSTARVIQSIHCSNFNSMNIQLFEQELVNVYAEPIKIIMGYRRLLELALNALFETNPNLWCSLMGMFTRDVLFEVNDLLYIIQDSQLPDSCGFGYPHHGFLAFKKLHSQMHVLFLQEALFESSYYSTVREISTKWKKLKSFMRNIMTWFLTHVNDEIF